jgi:hypothetical protein
VERCLPQSLKGLIKSTDRSKGSHRDENVKLNSGDSKVRVCWMTHQFSDAVWISLQDPRPPAVSRSLTIIDNLRECWGARWTPSEGKCPQCKWKEESGHAEVVCFHFTDAKIIKNLM